MEQTDREFFDDAEELFGTKGWKTFIADLQGNINRIRVENLSNSDEFFIAKGQLNVLHTIVGYEAGVNASLESHLNPPEEDVDADYDDDVAPV